MKHVFLVPALIFSLLFFYQVMGIAQTGVADDCLGEGEGEVWITSQTESMLKIVNGLGCVETLSDPSIRTPHNIEFSPSGKFAYVSNFGNGRVVVVRAEDRQVVTTINLNPANLNTRIHHAKPSPDGSIVLATNLDSRTIFRIRADESAETWAVLDSLSNPTDSNNVIQNPICVAFRSDGQRAYVSLGPGDIAEVDISGSVMEQVDTLKTNGGVQCGMVNSKDNRTIYVDSRGATGDGGHFYLLDTMALESEDKLKELNYDIGATSLTDFDVSPNEDWAFAADLGNHMLKILDLNSDDVEEVSLPASGDMVATNGNNVFVTMPTVGELAWFKTNQGVVKTVKLGLNPSTAAHSSGVAIRP